MVTLVITGNRLTLTSWTLGSSASAGRSGLASSTFDRTSDSAASAEPEKIVPSSAATEIFGLQYDRDEVRDRIAILGDKPASYRLYEPDEETLIIILDNAVLSEGMGERITPEFGGPISQVTIFQQPDIETNEVRVVLRRAPGLVPDVYQRGSLILADFPNTAVAPSLPVVLIPEEPGQVAEEEEAAAKSLAASTGLAVVRVRFFFTLGTLCFIRLLLEVFKISRWPLCCSRHRCTAPTNLQTVYSRGTVLHADHAHYTLPQLFEMYLPALVTTELYLNRVLEQFDATNIVLEFLVNAHAPGAVIHWGQIVFLCYFCKGFFNNGHGLLALAAYDEQRTGGEE